MWLFLAPLYAVIFLAIVEHGGRSDLASYAVLGPAAMALTGMAIYSAGEFVERDRWDGVLELEVAAPASFPLVIVGRILAIVSIGVLTVSEAWLVAGLAFGRWVAVPHPWVFTVTLLLTVAATAGAGALMAAVFVLARSARIFQNSLSFPLYLLGGAVVPVGLLPDWLRLPARLIYLSWATDLLRDATGQAPVADLWMRYAVVAGLGIATFLFGCFQLGRVVRRVRMSGTVSYA
jgi:ABC-2 type transport system permease protein